MQKLAKKENGYDLIKTNDIVGDHLKFVKFEFIRAGGPADMTARYAMLMESASTGTVLWEDG